MMQHKGDSECRLGAGTNDELCTSELLPYDSFMGRFLPFARHAARCAELHAHRARRAGSSSRRSSASNPFRFGLIGSTDTHLGAAGLVDERGHPGHGGAGDPDRRARCPTRCSTRSSTTRAASRALGRGELARRAIRGDAAPRDVRHERAAHRVPPVRGLGLSTRACARRRLRAARRRGGRADGRRAAAAAAPAPRP